MESFLICIFIIVYLLDALCLSNRHPRETMGRSGKICCLFRVIFAMFNQRQFTFSTHNSGFRLIIAKLRHCERLHWSVNLSWRFIVSVRSSSYCPIFANYHSKTENSMSKPKHSISLRLTCDITNRTASTDKNKTKKNVIIFFLVQKFVIKENERFYFYFPFSLFIVTAIKLWNNVCVLLR